MNGLARWVVVALAALAVVALLAFARGRAHHRGDETGAMTRSVLVAAPRG
jgi:hypothetical protein